MKSYAGPQHRVQMTARLKLEKCGSFLGESRGYPSFAVYCTLQVQRYGGGTDNWVIGCPAETQRGTRWIMGPGGTEWMDYHRRKAMRFVGYSPTSASLLRLTVGG